VCVCVSVLIPSALSQRAHMVAPLPHPLRRGRLRRERLFSRVTRVCVCVTKKMFYLPEINGRHPLLALQTAESGLDYVSHFHFIHLSTLFTATSKVTGDPGGAIDHNDPHWSHGGRIYSLRITPPRRDSAETRLRRDETPPRRDETPPRRDETPPRRDSTETRRHRNQTPPRRHEMRDDSFQKMEVFFGGEGRRCHLF